MTVFELRALLNVPNQEVQVLIELDNGAGYCLVDACKPYPGGDLILIPSTPLTAKED